jgi:hypothetical protein
VPSWTFLLEDSALMIVASTIVPVATFSLRRQMPLHLVEQPPAQIVLLKQAAETAHRGLIRHRLAAEVDPDKCRIASES